MIKVGIMFGGCSVEHEVSIISAIQAMKNLDKSKYEYVPIYITKNKEMYTGAFLDDVETYKDMINIKRYAKNITMYVKDNKIVLQNLKGLKRIVNEIDIVLPIVHGTNVEDGTLQGYLEMLGIPYVGSNVYAAAVGQDKVFMKQIFESGGLQIPKYTWFFSTDYINNPDKIKKQISKLGFPVIIKPARLGSSVGIEFANKKDELDDAINEAIKYDNKIVVEEVIQNLEEVNASSLGNYSHYEISELESVMGTTAFLSYEDKYLGNNKNGKLVGSKKSTGSKGMASANRVIPAKISKKVRKKIIEMTEEASRLLNTSGVVRIDYLVNKENEEVYINEVNTIPGSLAFYLWEAKGMKYKELLDKMITLAIKDYKRKQKITYSFDSNILENFNGTKGSKGKLG